MSNSSETNIQKKYNLSKNLVDKYLKNKFMINKLKNKIKNKIEELLEQYFPENFFPKNYFSKEKFSKKNYYSVIKEFIRSTDIHKIKLNLEQELELDKYINIEEEFIKNGELYIFLDKFIEKKKKVIHQII
jgi:chromosomal replication initiation ATPase DnaA